LILEVVLLLSHVKIIVNLILKNQVVEVILILGMIWILVRPSMCMTVRKSCLVNVLMSRSASFTKDIWRAQVIKDLWFKIRFISEITTMRDMMPLCSLLDVCQKKLISFIIRKLMGSLEWDREEVMHSQSKFLFMKLCINLELQI